MHVTGKYEGVHVSLDGKMSIVFAVNEKAKAMEELPKIEKCDKLVLDIVKYRERRSIDANAYFWKLCDMIAKHHDIRMDKDSIYIMQLSKYGIFYDVQIKKEALKMLQESYRYTEVLEEDEEFAICRCYVGSSNYNTKEMSELISGTVEDAKALGIETLTPDELKAMYSKWSEKHETDRNDS